MAFPLTMDGLAAMHAQQQEQRAEELHSIAPRASLPAADKVTSGQGIAMPMKCTAKRPATEQGDDCPKRVDLKEDSAVLMDRLRSSFEFVDNHFLGLSRTEKERKKVQSAVDVMGCSEAQAEEIVKQIAQEAADKRGAEDAVAAAATTARTHESGTVWAVQFDIYQRGRDIKPKLHSTHLTEQAATERAKRWWTTDTHGVDGLTILSKPDEPYEANACIEYGGAVGTVAVIRSKVSELKGAMIKQALVQRGAPTSGSVKEQRERLEALVA